MNFTIQTMKIKLIMMYHLIEQLGGDRNWIKNRNSGTQPEFRFRLIKKRKGFKKLRFLVNKNRIGDFKIRFPLIRTGLRRTKSGKKTEFRFLDERFGFVFSIFRTYFRVSSLLVYCISFTFPFFSSLLFVPLRRNACIKN